MTDMNPVDTAVHSLRDCPVLPRVVERLRADLEAERISREAF